MPPFAFKIAHKCFEVIVKIILTFNFNIRDVYWQ